MTRIAELNDALRKTLQGGRVVMTASVQALPPETVARALSTMRRFDRFTEDNDPHQEHDFGKFDADGHEFFFKIDYYDPALEYGSEDPADPSKTVSGQAVPCSGRRQVG
jgi:hypothetical protein